MPTKKVQVLKYSTDFFGHKADEVSIEEPLEIRIVSGSLEERKTTQVAITMRTPGNDEALAIGFLINENIIEDYKEIMKISRSTYHKGELNENILTVMLYPTSNFSENDIKRNFYTTSSCGICGKASIEAIKMHKSIKVKSDLSIDANYILSLPKLLAEKQIQFKSTGGIHAVGLFVNNKIISFAEDVGRHNAMDKLIGQMHMNNYKKFNASVLLLSGRASFELLQKTAVNEIPIVCAVGAPSSLAVEIANEFGITLIGFVRENSFNVYTHEFRILQ